MLNWVKSLQVDAQGQFSRRVQAILGVLSLVLAAMLLLLVRQAVPSTETGAQLALAGLFIGAMSGFARLFTLILQLIQGADVKVRI